MGKYFYSFFFRTMNFQTEGKGVTQYRASSKGKDHQKNCNFHIFKLEK